MRSIGQNADDGIALCSKSRQALLLARTLVARLEIVPFFHVSESPVLDAGYNGTDSAQLEFFMEAFSAVADETLKLL